MTTFSCNAQKFSGTEFQLHLILNYIYLSFMSVLYVNHGQFILTVQQFLSVLSGSVVLCDLCPCISVVLNSLLCGRRWWLP